ncbi:dipeptide ABC transporter ATP-binding protein [Rhodococcoides yunnanense]|uniref:dipeptide ABC transporter ATP-binding protein n=1 Tax=Rhodococcoides yunnanense TaxID=278209 RepID=UPI0009326BB4|nr:ABC transporter ATP-binding protein [Rhodococcus yunnanensis]
MNAETQEQPGSVIEVRPDPVVDIRGLTIAYGDSSPSVKGVDLVVQPGEIVGLIGESGSGKSSVAMACLGLLDGSARVDGDRFSVCGTDMVTAGQSELVSLRGRRAAMVFQDAMGALDPCTRVGKQVAEVVKRHRGLGKRECADAVIDLFERVGIPQARTRVRQYPHQLSGGLRQRVAVALALAGEPELLLADEPTTALDVTVQAGILELFRSVRDEFGIAILLISHDIGVIAQTADRVAVMLDGAIVEQGDVEDVLLRPRTAYTRELLRAVPTIERTAAEDETSTAASPPQGEPVFSVQNLSRSYGSGRETVNALSDISLDVHRGEVLGIVGESGSGKSTLAKILIQLETPTTGSVSFEDTGYAGMGRAKLKQFRSAVQMVFQHPTGSLNPRLRVDKSVSEPLMATGAEVNATRVRQVLGEVGLPQDCGDRLPHQFSGGQKQRIAIARAIVASPEVVLLDEPTSALDVTVQAQVLELLARIQRDRGLTYILISHNLAVVRAISDRVAVMKAGEIVELGTPAEVFDNPSHPYTKTLVAAVPSVDPRHRRRAAIGPTAS